jgi:hypothetical protein
MRDQWPGETVAPTFSTVQIGGRSLDLIRPVITLRMPVFSGRQISIQGYVGEDGTRIRGRRVW